MDKKIDEIIKEIAITHGVSLGKNDPILILTTINSRLIEDSQKGQKIILEEFKAELEEKDQLLLDISQTIKKYKGDNDSLSLRFNVISKKPN